MVTPKQYKKVSDTFLNEMYYLLDQYLFNNIETDDGTKELIREELVNIVVGDICALVAGDPAARSLKKNEETENYSFDYVWRSYKGLRAVVTYRVANYIYYYHTTEYAKRDYYNLDALEFHLKLQARRLSEEAKVRTAVEIHPAARIGERFVIDHGYGTVIGETTIIGDDCYFLQGVVLGANGIKNNQDERRHPKIGNNVQIAGCARVFGPVTIGDNTVINGYAIVDYCVPPSSTVSILNQLQITRPAPTPMTIYGVRPLDDCLEVFGKYLTNCECVKLLNEKDEVLSNIIVSIDKTDDIMHLKFPQINSIINDNDIEEFGLSFLTGNSSVILKKSKAWKDFVKNLKK